MNNANAICKHIVKVAQANRTKPNFAKELTKPTQKNWFKNFPTLQKNKKQQTNGKTPAPNRQFGKMAGLVQNSTAVLRLNFCAKTEYLCFNFRHFAKLQTVRL